MRNTSTNQWLRAYMAGLLGLIGLVLFLPGPALAQVSRYVFSQSVRPYIPITGGTRLALAAANAGPGPLALSGTVHTIPVGAVPFPFNFNGTSYFTGTYPEAYVASGGYLTLGPVAPHSRFTPKPGRLDVYDIDHPLSEPEGTGYDGAVAAMAGDVLANVDPAALGEIRYETLGTAPARVFVVQWRNMRVYNSTAGTLNFQVRLHETTNVIELAYGPSQSDLAMSVQVGLRGYNPNDFHTRTGTWGNSAFGLTNTDALLLGPGTGPASGLVYSFTPPAPQPCPVPFSLAASPAGTRARLSWRAQAPSAGPYTVVYGLFGFNPAMGGLGTQTGVTGTSTTITGLNPNTAYEFYVTQQCAGGSSPISSPPGRFRTTVLNDEAVDAVTLPVQTTCQPLSSTAQGATLSAGNGYDPLVDCNGFSPLPAEADVWFAFTTAASGPASTAVQIAGTGATATRVRVLRATSAAGPFTQVYCGADPSNSQVFPPFVLTGLTPGTTYYLLVSAAGPFTVCATVPPPCGDPTGVSSSFTNSTSTTAQVAFMPGSGATQYTISLTPAGGTTQTITSASTTSPITLTGLTPATTYAATLQASCANGGASAVIPFTVYTRPANDAPADAVVLPVAAGCQPVAGSTLNAGVTVPALRPPSGCGDTAPFDVWFRFTTPATGPASQGVRIEVSGVGAQQVRVFTIGPMSDFQQVACSAASATTPAPVLDLTGLTPGATYYVLVGNYARPARQGPFTICISEPPTCGAPQGLAASGVTATTANLTFTAGQPVATAGYRLTLTPQGRPASVQSAAGTGGSIPLNSLLPGTFYTVALQADCGTGGLSLPAIVQFRTAGPPSNDLCGNAVAVSCDASLPGTVKDATASGEPTGACAGTAPLGPGVWYRMAGTGQTVTLTFCSGFADDPDLQLLVYSGACGALQCIGSNDDGAACSVRWLPTLSFATTAGQDYYLLVVDTGRRGAAQSSGRFDMLVNCAAPTACPAPTGLSLTQLAPGGATVSWAGASGASSYQVVWQPLSGATQPVVAQTTNLTATTSLLRPNTPYMVTVSTVCGNRQQQSVGASVTFSTPLSARLSALAGQVSLYPNPAHTAVTLFVPASLRAGSSPAALYNGLGQVVRQFALVPGRHSEVLDLAGLPPGRYVLRLGLAAGTITKALIVE